MGIEKAKGKKDSFAFCLFSFGLTSDV